MEKRVSALIGKGVVDMTGKNTDPSTGAATTHLEDLKRASLSEIKDGAGVVTGYKFNEHAMYNAMSGILKHEPTMKVVKENKTNLVPFRNIRAAATIKAITERNNIGKSKARVKEADIITTEKHDDSIEKLQEEINKIPDESFIDIAISTHTPYDPPADATGKKYDGKRLRAVNMAIAKYSMELGRTTGPRVDKKLELENKIKDERKAYEDHVKKLKSDLEKTRSDLANHLESLEEKNK